MLTLALSVVLCVSAPYLQETTTGTHYIALGQTADQIDPNIKAGYVNEALVGFEYEALPGLVLGVRYIHRDIPRIVEDMQL